MGMQFRTLREARAAGWMGGRSQWIEHGEDADGRYRIRFGADVGNRIMGGQDNRPGLRIERLHSSGDWYAMGPSGLDCKVEGSQTVSLTDEPNSVGTLGSAMSMVRRDQVLDRIAELLALPASEMLFRHEVLAVLDDEEGDKEHEATNG